MDKVTQVNIEGHNYEFVAGQAVSGVCSSSAASYIKVITLPEGADVVPGMLIAVRFSEGNTAGYELPQTVYSSDGVSYYWDSQLTDPVTLPPAGCYEITPVSGQQFSFTAWPIISVAGRAKPLCDCRGHKRGGSLWDAGDVIVVLALDNAYIAVALATSTVASGYLLPVTSDAVAAYKDVVVTQNGSKPVTGAAVWAYVSSIISSYAPVSILTINENTAMAATEDCRIMIDTANVELVLQAIGSSDGVEAIVYAFQDCTLTYYTDNSTTATLSMAANTAVKLIYHNGWKRNGTYDAVWN